MKLWHLRINIAKIDDNNFMKQTLKYIYGIIYENMKFAEAKHGIILTLSSAVIAFASTFFSLNALQNLMAIASIIFALIAILYSFVALVARKVRVKQKKVKDNDNLLFYKHVMHYDEHTYIEKIKKKYAFTSIYKQDAMDYDLAGQIIATSKIASLKFLYFNFAVLFLIASIICLIITVLIKGGII